MSQYSYVGCGKPENERGSVCIPESATVTEEINEELTSPGVFEGAPYWFRSKLAVRRLRQRWTGHTRGVKVKPQPTVICSGYTRRHARYRKQVSG